MTETVGILHPGEMGAAVGAALVEQGLRVVWASAGRSHATSQRAAAASLEDVGTAVGVAAEADVILSICPPAAAIETARSVAGFTGVYVDANAVSPSTAATAGAIVTEGGAVFVDGGLIGGPPTPRDNVHLYLSGEAAPGVAELFEGCAVDARVLGTDIGSASALKCAYAAWTKGTTALLLAIRQYARASGADDALLAEWSESLPDLADRCARGAASARAKGWRWVAEMEEIAAAFETQGLPGGFHQAAAEMFEAGPDADAAG